MNLIKSFGDFAVSFNQAGFLNATQIAKHFGKQPRDYLKTQPTQEYIAALAASLSIKNKILIDKNQLVIIKKGSSCNGGGTWLHPKLAIHFARWLDPKFAVWCDEQIEQILAGSLPIQQPLLPDEDVRTLQDLLHHLPYVLAYYHRTYEAVRLLNPMATYRTHDHVAEVSGDAHRLVRRLGLSAPSWRDVMHHLG